MHGTDITNRLVAGKLFFMGQLLEISQENPFKVRAFYRAADVVEKMPRPVAGMDQEDLISQPGIGRQIAGKIQEIAKKGTFQELEDLKSTIPLSLIELLSLEGIGPKTVRTLWKKLNIESIDDLERAARGHRIRALKGFGEKKEEGFLKAVAQYKNRSDRMTRPEAEAVVDKISPAFSTGTFEVAGSFRRGLSTIGDIDIVTLEPPGRLNPKLRAVAEEIIDTGDRRTSIRSLGRRIDVRFASPDQYGSMLLYLTGSKAFNIRMREIAMARGMKLNEYGIWEGQTNQNHEFRTEEALFSYLGLDYIPPELREDLGEIRAAVEHTLPDLITRADVKGDLHVHSNWSDGALSLAELAIAGEQVGYEYLVCSDHSATLGVAHGIDEETIRRQAHEIESVNRSSGCQLLHGIEVDIMGDGSLGLNNKVLADLDIVIASVHSAFSQERDILTRRVLTAMENENVDILGHPTGRILGRRQPYEIDIARVIEHARETGTVLECNASPFRLDLDDTHIRLAVNSGVRIAIGTDSHNLNELVSMQYGITTCRRGWATSADVLNCHSLTELREVL